MYSFKLSLFLLLALPFQLYALRFSPMNIYLGTAAQDQKTIIYIENDNQTKKVAIDLRATTREVAKNGKETRVTTKDISIYPPQVILEPKEKRGIRVRYVGDSKFTVEKSYRLIAEELPVSIDTQESKDPHIKILMKYVAALYVTPLNASAKISIESFYIEKQNLKILLSNTGSKHQILKDISLKLTNDKDVILLKDQQLKGLIQENILAKSKREFSIPWNYSQITTLKNWTVTINE